jgi:hypothetical protein
MGPDEVQVHASFNVKGKNNANYLVHNTPRNVLDSLIASDLDMCNYASHVP